MRDPLEDEAADLLAEHEDEWTQPLHGIAEDWRFSRGFIEHVTIRGEDFLTHAERLLAFAPIRSVHFLIGLKDVPHLAACSCLQWLESLDFRRCHLSDRSLQQLMTSPHLKRLTALDLTGNGIGTPGIQALVHSLVLGQLTRLDLSRNLGVGDKAVHLLARASQADNLRALSLAHTNITAIDNLFQSSHLTSLTDLNISGTRFTPRWGASTEQALIDSRLLGQLRSLDLSETATPGGVRFLLESPRVAGLQALSLRGIHAGEAVADKLANSPHLANLTILDLRKNDLGAVDALALAHSPHLGSLTYLDLSSNNIRDTGTRSIAASGYLTRLTVLDLARNDIGGPGLKALAASANLSRLATLNLAGNFIGSDSLQALASSPHLSRLAHLDLSDAHLEGDSVRALAASANLERLTTLLLQQNQLGDSGAKALTQSLNLKRLTTLNLSQNRIGKAGAEVLAAAPSWRRLRSSICAETCSPIRRKPCCANASAPH